MPTNEERLKVAARLREIAPGSDWPNMTAETCGLNPSEMSNSLHEFTGELCSRLADLIEPEPEPERTCRNVADDYDGMGFVCSECTRAVPEDEYDPEIDEFKPGSTARSLKEIASFCDLVIEIRRSDDR